VKNLFIFGLSGLMTIVCVVCDARKDFKTKSNAEVQIHGHFARRVQ
jgi:hypothetical protein